MMTSNGASAARRTHSACRPCSSGSVGSRPGGGSPAGQQRAGRAGDRRPVAGRQLRERARPAGSRRSRRAARARARRRRCAARASRPAAACSAAARSSCVLPIPAGPSMTTIAPRRRRARSRASASAESSFSRSSSVAVLAPAIADASICASRGARKVRGGSTMRSGRPQAEDRRVTAVSSRRVVVVLEPAPAPISGSVEGPDGVRRGFEGWLELCALLEAARAAGRRSTTPGGCVMLGRAALVAVTLALGAPAVASAAADIEGVWSFNGGQIAVKAQSDGTFTGWVIRQTVFDQCPHVDRRGGVGRHHRPARRVLLGQAPVVQRVDVRLHRPRQHRLPGPAPLRTGRAGSCASASARPRTPSHSRRSRPTAATPTRCATAPTPT